MNLAGLLVLLGVIADAVALFFGFPVTAPRRGGVAVLLVAIGVLLIGIGILVGRPHLT